MIVPSIDLMNGKAVQLERGERLVLERDDVEELARAFGRVGEVAVIDLDAALGRGENRALIERLCSIAPCRVGGGIRDVGRARRYLQAGAARVIVGTAADVSLLRALPKQQTIVAIDARNDRVATHGWQRVSEETPEERARRLAPYCGGFLFTDVAREGMMAGFDWARIEKLRAATDNPLTVAGGITRIEEVMALDRAGIDAQVGMAAYTGRLDIVDAFVATIDFEKCGGAVPTVVCDRAGGRVRMLAYSTRESLAAAVREGRGVYWSRSRQELWRKGDTSGSVQYLNHVTVDCDRDALVFHVEQIGGSCHSGNDRCFPGATFSWEDLATRVDARVAVPAADSYTRKLLDDPKLLAAKLREETDEVIDAPNRDNLIWECADLLYFLTVRMRAGDVEIADVMAHLSARAL